MQLPLPNHLSKVEWTYYMNELSIVLAEFQYRKCVFSYHFSLVAAFQELFKAGLTIHRLSSFI